MTQHVNYSALYIAVNVWLLFLLLPLCDDDEEKEEEDGDDFQTHRPNLTLGTLFFFF